MWAVRSTLPIHRLAGDVVRACEQNQVVIVVGETGSGKTTQVPQLIMDEWLSTGRGGRFNMLCTQPRRVAAIGVSERVGQERGERSGGPGALVAHQIRLESTRTDSTRLLFCTTGVLLRRLSDTPDLDGISHICVDEAHERDLLCDFLLILLRDLCRRRRDLKVIVMSATIDFERFSDYFGGAPVVMVPGKTFPVEELYLEDLLEATGHRIQPGSDCALRGQSARGGGGRAKVSYSVGRGNTATANVEWEEGGEDGGGDENEWFHPKFFEGCPQHVHQSLRIVDEARINYDLIEDCLKWIDEKEAKEQGGGVAGGAPPAVAESWDDEEDPAPPAPAPGGGGKGGVLVFLPGMGEITQLHERLRHSRVFSRQDQWRVVAVHSSLSTEDQRAIFRRVPEGCRKVVLATNIAETSITIDDISYVIDTGKVRQTFYDERKRMKQLIETWVDAASMRQRSGRAGRVRAGTALRLYTSVRARTLQEFKSPEMRRVPLEELCLMIKGMGFLDVQAFLAKAMDPPRDTAVEVALRTLAEVQALAPDGRLTPLGHHLSKLPVDPHIGKMLVYAAVFRCLGPVLTIAACCSYKSPFAGGVERRAQVDAARHKFAGQNPSSDLLPLVKAYDGWEEALGKGAGAGRAFCAKHFLSEATLVQIRDMRRQFRDLLAGIGFDHRPEGGRDGGQGQLPGGGRPGRGGRSGGGGGGGSDGGGMDSYSGSTAVVCGVVFAGLYPNMLRADVQGLKVTLRGAGDSSQSAIHPSSLLRDSPAVSHGSLIAFHERLQTTRSFVRDATVIHPNAALVFGGGDLKVDHVGGAVTLDGWLTLGVPARTAVMLRELRGELEGLLARKISSPRLDLQREGGGLVAAVVALLGEEGKRG